jgi:hypothetical protein
MMAFGFRELANLLDKGQRLPEITKPEAPVDAASFLREQVELPSVGGIQVCGVGFEERPIVVSTPTPTVAKSLLSLPACWISKLLKSL